MKTQTPLGLDREFQKKYDLVFYIGRYEPFHNAHDATVKNALIYSENVCIVIGSANSPRTPKNPFTAAERAAMIQAAIDSAPYDSKRVSIAFSNDYVYDDPEWLKNTGKMFMDKIKELGAKRVAITGHKKDHSSYYLDYFPQFEFLEMPRYPLDGGETIDATKVRDLLFKEDFHFIKGVLPPPVYQIIREKFVTSDDFHNLVKEDLHNKEYNPKNWDVNVLTTDAVVVQSGHILLVQRDGYPGNGLWALPGGHLETKERVLDGMVRELVEETGLKVPEKVLKGSIVHQEYFDDPGRSAKARVLTFAFLIQLDDSQSLPRIKGQEGEVKKAQWIPLAEFEDMCEVMFEDHWHIARSMLNRAKN